MDKEQGRALARDIQHVVERRLEQICEDLDDLKRRHETTDEEIMGHLKQVYIDVPDYWEDWIFNGTDGSEASV